MQVECITKARRAVVFHSQIFSNNKILLKSLVINVLEAVDNLRSVVSRNAIACLADMFQSLGKTLDGDLDLMVSRVRGFELSIIRSPRLCESTLIPTNSSKMIWTK